MESNSITWLTEIKDPQFVKEFHIFANIPMDINVTHELEPEDDYQHWLDIVLEELNTNNTPTIVRATLGRRNNGVLLNMKFDGKYSGYQKFIKTICKAFKHNGGDPLIWRKIKSVMLSFTLNPANIIDYEDIFLEYFYVELENNRDRLIFASILQNCTIACDLLDICITNRLLDCIPLELKVQENRHKSDSRTEQRDFLQSKDLFTACSISESNLYRAITGILTTTTYEKMTTYFALFARFRKVDLDLKEFLFTYLSLHSRYGLVADIEIFLIKIKQY